MSFKSAKSLSGTVYSYAAHTTKEFLGQLSTEKDIPLHLLCLLDSDGELSDSAVLSDDEMYSLFVKEGVKYRKWVILNKIDRSGLDRNPFSEYIFRYSLDRGVGKDYPRRTLARDMIYIDYDYYARWFNSDAVQLAEQNPDEIDWNMLSKNPHAISFLEKNLEKVCVRSLCINTAVFSMEEKAIEWFIQKVGENQEYWHYLSYNPSAIPLLEKNLDKVDWQTISYNSAALPLIEKNLDKVDWKELSCNHSAIPLLEKNLDKVDWKELSSNPSAFPLLEQNLDKVDWKELSSQSFAIPLLEKNLDKIDWREISRNPMALHLIEQNLDKIDWRELSSNPVIFERYELF
jgi:hypothetical protein